MCVFYSVYVCVCVLQIDSVCVCVCVFYCSTAGSGQAQLFPLVLLINAILIFNLMKVVG